MQRELLASRNDSDAGAWYVALRCTEPVEDPQVWVRAVSDGSLPPMVRALCMEAVLTRFIHPKDDLQQATHRLGIESWWTFKHVQQSFGGGTGTYRTGFHIPGGSCVYGMTPPGPPLGRPPVGFSDWIMLMSISPDASLADVLKAARGESNTRFTIDDIAVLLYYEPTGEDTSTDDGKATGSGQ
jgi:hypothetical protein